MTSKRKRKKEAASRGLNVDELELVELVEELLEAVRWQQILGYANQFLLDRFVDVPRHERDKILEAATRAVDKDARLHEWHARLARLKDESTRIRRQVARGRRDMQQGRDMPPAPGADPEREGDAEGS